MLKKNLFFFGKQVCGYIEEDRYFARVIAVFPLVPGSDQSLSDPGAGEVHHRNYNYDTGHHGAGFMIL